MANVFDVAKLMIQVRNAQAEEDTGDPMTNLRLNKLLYFAQGYSLAKHGVPLFDSRIEAWGKGPVVPEVYHHYKGFGQNMIVDTPADRDAFSDSEYSLILDVLIASEPYSTNKLVNISHEKGAPWRNLYTGAHNIEIPVTAIREYFIAHPFVEHGFDEVLERMKENAYRPERDQNGTPIIPKAIAEGWDG